MPPQGKGDRGATSFFGRALLSGTGQKSNTVPCMCRSITPREQKTVTIKEDSSRGLSSTSHQTKSAVIPTTKNPEVHRRGPRDLSVPPFKQVEGGRGTFRLGNIVEGRGETSGRLNSNFYSNWNYQRPVDSGGGVRIPPQVSLSTTSEEVARSA